MSEAIEVRGLAARMWKCKHGLPAGWCTCTADRCSRCGEEKDAERNCPNYCTGEKTLYSLAAARVANSR